jgi:DNA repair exonuclease SbcCD nuclease subunit
MTLAHLSDTHLGYRRFHKTTPEGFNQREADVLQTFETALQAIAARNPDLVIHAGDLFDRVRPGNATIVRTYAALNRHQEQRLGKPFVIIGGNHDTPRTSDVGNILRLFSGIPGVEVRTEAIEYVDFPDLKAEVLCAPHEALRKEPNPNFAPSGKRKFKFLTLHGLLTDAMRFEREDRQGLTLQGLHANRWDYVALGDFHTHTKYAPNVAYAGATDFTSSDIWAEAAEAPKGWVWFDTAIGRLEFFPIQGVRPTLDLPTIDAEHLTDAEVLQALYANFTWKPDQSPVVRQLVLNARADLRTGLRVNLLRDLHAACLNYQLDLRPRPSEGSNLNAAAGSIEEDWQAHIATAQIPAAIDREALHQSGLQLIQEVRADAPPAA